MKKRYAYSVLFGIPGFFLSGMLAGFAAAASMGIFWLFIFGDSSWPISAEAVLLVVLVVIFFACWITFLGMGYSVGKRLEADPAWNWGHILISAGLTLLFILAILFQQWSVGNIGPKSNSVLCSDFCVKQGYSGSGMPPLTSGDRTCSCYDNSGNEALTVPLDRIDPDSSK